MFLITSLGWTACCSHAALMQVKCTIFLGYTSNMISCGVREVIRFLVQHKLVRRLVSVAWERPIRVIGLDRWTVS